MNIVNFIKKNYAWIFSGLGIALTNAIYKHFKSDDSKILSSIIITVIILFASVIAIEIILFLKRREIGLYLKAKIRELLHFFLGDKVPIVKTSYKYDCYELHDKYKDFAFLIKKSICDNQGLIVNYYFNGGRLHKKIKDVLRCGNTQNEQFAEKLYQHCCELNSYLYEGLIKAIKINHDHLLEYFGCRSKYGPRIVIKAFDGNQIVDIFRLKNEYYTEYPLTENRGFFYVYKHGTAFLCNDIPSKAAKDDYFNPRLNNQKVREYLSAIEAGEKMHDYENWIDCWTVKCYSIKNQKDIRSSPESCYKSTLIIPMTLLNNEGLSEDFRNHFKIPLPSADKELGRAIYGFLCFDHTQANYFEDPLDIKIGYVFADLLSLFFIERLNFTKYSGTFNEALEIIGDKPLN